MSVFIIHTYHSMYYFRAIFQKGNHERCNDSLASGIKIPRLVSHSHTQTHTDRQTDTHTHTHTHTHTYTHTHTHTHKHTHRDTDTHAHERTHAQNTHVDVPMYLARHLTSLHETAVPVASQPF